MKKHGKSNYFVRGMQSILLPVVVYLLFLILSGGRFGQPKTMLVIFRQSICPIMLAYGITANMAMGMWDFSAGAVIYCAAIIGANTAIKNDMGVLWMIILCVLVGMGITALTGLLYNLLKLPSLVLTIGLCMIYESLAMGVMGGEVYAPRSYTYIARAPYCFIILIVGVAVMYILYNKTVFGHNLRVIGDNQAVAKSTGMKIAKFKFASFVLGGAYIGVAAVIMLTNNSVVSAPSTLGSMSVIFDAMMGFFIGMFLSKYCNLVFGVMIGAFTIKMLSVALVAVGLSASLRDVITGLFLLVLLCISSNQNLLADLRQRKADIKAANEEYAKRTMESVS